MVGCFFVVPPTCLDRQSRFLSAFWRTGQDYQLLPGNNDSKMTLSKGWRLPTLTNPWIFSDFIGKTPVFGGSQTSFLC